MKECPDCKVEMKLMCEGGTEKRIRQYQCGQCKGIFQTFGKVTARAHEGGQTWKCVDCGSEIEVEEVAHTVRDGLFAFSGSGRVSYESVPFCPKCDKKPSFHGTAITEEGRPTA